MRLPAFAYHRAESTPDAVAVLAEHGDEARVLAGGQSLLPHMLARRTAPRVLVDVTRAPDLAGFALGDDAVVVRAGATVRSVETDRALAAAHPLVPAVLRHSGHPEIRARGTACGSLGHADPASEVPALLLALDGAAHVASARGERRIGAAEILRGPYRTALARDELITALELPLPAADSGVAVRELARRDGDFATVGVIAVLAPGDPRVALFGAADTAYRARATERALREGASPDEAAAHAFDGVEVTSDLHASAAYRRRAGTALVARTLQAATRQAAHA